MLDFHKALPIFQLWFCILGNPVLSVRWPAMCFKHWKGWSLRTWWSSSASMLLPMTSPGPLRPWLCPRCFTFIQIVAVAHHQSQKLSKTRVWKFKTWNSKLQFGGNSCLDEAFHTFQDGLTGKLYAVSPLSFLFQLEIYLGFEIRYYVLVPHGAAKLQVIKFWSP